MKPEDPHPLLSIVHNETGRTVAAGPAVAVLRAVKKWGPAAVFAIVAYFALFRLPFHFPPKQFLVSASYAFGFNNAVAVLAMASLLVVATLYRLFPGGPRVFDPRVGFAEEGARKTLLSPVLLAAMVMAYALLTAGMYAYTRGADPGMLTWESQHFMHRIKLVEMYGLRPYVEIQAEYGPALMYPPIYLHQVLAPLGVSPQAAYFLCHFLMNVAGVWCLWYLLGHAVAPARAKATIFVVIGIAGFGVWMGLNGVVLRYACPFGAVFIGHRAWIRLRERTSPMREVGMILVLVALAWVNILLSPEIALAFALGWLSYAVLWTRKDWRLMSLSLPALAMSAVGCHFLLPDAYYGSLLRFSQGANNLPMVPAAHLILYLLTMALIVPPLMAAGWRGGRPDAPLLGSLGLLCVAMMPGALGRCDPPHVLFYGLVASLLLMVRLANVSRVAYRVYVLAYFVVFIGMMHLANLVVFFGVSAKDLVNHPARAVYNFIAQQRAEFSPRDKAYLAALDKYPAIGIPFATYGQDNAAEDYLFANRKIAPEYYVALVGVYTEAELLRKLADTFRHEYLLVKKGWAHHWDAKEYALMILRRSFLYPVNLPWIRPDLDTMGSASRFIAEHYRVVEEIGKCVVLQRLDASQPMPGELAN